MPNLEEIRKVLDDEDLERVVVHGVGLGDSLDLAGWNPAKGNWYECSERFALAGGRAVIGAHVSAGVVDRLRITLHWAKFSDRVELADKRGDDEREPWDYLGRPRGTKNGLRTALARGYFRLDIAESNHFEVEGEEPQVERRYELYRVAERHPSKAERGEAGDRSEAAAIAFILDHVDAPAGKRRR